MELKETVDLMLSEDYLDRLKAEYYQLAIRVQKLQKAVEKDKSKILATQLKHMSYYLNILGTRLILEGVSI